MDSSLPSIDEALRRVRARMAAALASAGRGPTAARLIAVSKRHSPEKIRAAYQAGQRDFGENYAQEQEKAAALQDLKDLRWHFLGHLQSNKAKLVAPLAHWVHSLDSESLARELDRRAIAPLRCLIEINLGGENQKGGIGSPVSRTAAAAVTPLFLPLAARGVDVHSTASWRGPPAFCRVAPAV